MLVVLKLDDKNQDDIVVHGLETGNTTCVVGVVKAHYVDDEAIEKAFECLEEFENERFKNKELLFQDKNKQIDKQSTDWDTRYKEEIN